MYTFRRGVPDDWSGSHLVVIVDSVMPAKAVEPWVHSAIASIDPTVPADMEVLDQTVNRLADRPRFETALLAFFAFAGLALAVVGLYGLMAFLTTQRTHEIGIRMALGATRENILLLITGDGFRMVAVGGTIGLAVALAISRLLKALIFQVSPTDPLTFVLVSLILSVVTLIAIAIPARAGMRVEPAATLRAE
jgi:predicted lysophospholipase L1 biosynthesis ABC-type transport system permease subunit